ncbi:MAG: response regulator [Rhodospirillales bacterium]|jgi:CheY-like chemotaxis protein|nr:response regulator [Rhodospirillales bacterium]
MKPSTPTSTAANGPVVLVVEDDPAVREATLWVLGVFGYATREAANGPDALEILAASPEITIMFSDVVMPKGMSGIELTQTALRRRPDLKVLLTTGYSQADLDLSQLARDDVQLITKPYSNDDLEAALKALLAG